MGIFVIIGVYIKRNVYHLGNSCKILNMRPVNGQ